MGSPSAQAEPITPVITGHAAVGWGYNGDGELGDGTTADRLLFGTVGGLGGVVQVAAGDAHSLAVTSAGTVWAWGGSLYGQLGNGTTADSSVPVQVKGLTGVVAVAAGYGHSLALRDDGTVWAWGLNGAGQLGNGTTGNTQPTPVEVAGLTGVTKIAAGGLFSLALRSDGTVWAWGGDGTGEMGDGRQTAAQSRSASAACLRSPASPRAGTRLMPSEPAASHFDIAVGLGRQRRRPAR